MKCPSFVALFAFSSSLTISLAAPSPDPTSSAAAPVSTACGDIVNACDVLFLASDVYECLVSVPFVPAIAARFIKYYNETIQFQSTLAYLKTPPKSYQQPAVDFQLGLQHIQEDIDAGNFANHYAFEIALQNLIYRTHDSHVNLIAGLLAAFTFASPYGIVSVSEDGVQLPKVYISEDLFDSATDGTWKPSAITTINGQNVTDFLTQFAAVQAFGGLEPNADWNLLMSSAALDIQAESSIFEGYTTFYPGANISFAFENGTTLDELPWLAFYNTPGDTGPLATGGDFFNFFVLGFYPASYDPTATTYCASSPTPAPTNGSAASSSSDAAAAATSDVTTTSATTTEASIATAPASSPGWDNPAYPSTPDLAQADLGGTGVLTAYFLKDILTAVLSVPSFLTYDDESTAAFSNFIQVFLADAKSAGMEKVLIDLQQNGGGDTLLAVDTFKQFFPDIDPFAGSRLRAHPTADVLGNTYTTYYGSGLNETFYDALSDSDWNSADRINADTGANFSSWGEFFGPHEYNGDTFTTTQRDNFSSVIFDQEASGGITVYGFADRPVNVTQQYTADNIVILSDGLCSSTCALFMELMHHQGGVETVVVGGRPSNGPMQAPAGSRGAQSYTFGPEQDLDSDIQFAELINGSTTPLLPDLVEDILITFGEINLRDQIRKGENIPLQFVYEAANCRIFYSFDTWYNYTNLWKYAANATWTTPTLCIEGSTGFATANNTESDTFGTEGGSSAVYTGIYTNLTGVNLLSGVQQDNPASFSGAEVDIVRSSKSSPGQACDPAAKSGSLTCQGGGTTCTFVVECGKNLCTQAWHTASSTCDHHVLHESTQTVRGRKKKYQTGYCIPSNGCSGNTKASVGVNDIPLPPESNAKGNDGDGLGWESSPIRDTYLSSGTVAGAIEAGLLG